MTLRIRKRFLEEIAYHSKEAFPIEACGILAGRFSSGDVRVVEKVYRVRNLHQSSCSFLMDPEEQYKVSVKVEGEGLEVIGFYHSHPYWSASASEIDLRQASYPGLSYVIYSIPEKSLKSYIFREEKLVPEPVEVEDDS